MLCGTLIVDCISCTILMKKLLCSKNQKPNSYICLAIMWVFGSGLASCIYYDMKKMVRWKFWLCLVYFPLYWIDQFPLLFECSIDSFTNAISCYMICSIQELLLIQSTLSMIYKDAIANSHFKFTAIWGVVNMQNYVFCMCGYIFHYLHVCTYMCICFQSTALFWVYIGDTALFFS